MYMIPGGDKDEYTVALVGKLKDIVREELRKEEEELEEAAKNLPEHFNTYIPWNDSPSAIKHGAFSNMKYCNCCKVAYKKPSIPLAICCGKKKEKKGCCSLICGSCTSIGGPCTSMCDGSGKSIPMGCDCCPIPGLDFCHFSANIPEICVGLCGLCCIEEYEDEYSNRGIKTDEPEDDGGCNACVIS